MDVGLLASSSWLSVKRLVLTYDMVRDQSEQA